MSLNTIIEELEERISHPSSSIAQYRKEGYRIIGVPPCHVPEEILWASHAVPIGLWGSERKAVLSKEYFPSFFCSLLTTDLEMLLSGQLDCLDGIVLTELCDSLKSFSQNIQRAKPELKCLPLSLPQQTEGKAVVFYLKEQLSAFAAEAGKLTGQPMDDASLSEAIREENRVRLLERAFVSLAAKHSKSVSPWQRCVVLKSRYFLSPLDSIAVLEKINTELSALPEEKAEKRILTAGIIFDNRETLEMMKEDGLSICADRILYEEGSYGYDAPTEDLDGLCQRYLRSSSSLLGKKLDQRLADFSAALDQEHPDGVLYVMTKFCDPEEYDYPFLKRLASEKGYPFLTIEMDKGGESLGQNQTILDAFGEMI